MMGEGQDGALQRSVEVLVAFATISSIRLLLTQLLSLYLLRRFGCSNRFRF
jgi:hypothetical protein